MEEVKTRTTIEALPNELLVNVFELLGGDDLRALQGVNRRFAFVLQQERLLYRHGKFTRHGLRFLGAENPFPFSDAPELGMTPLSGIVAARLLSKVQTLVLGPHRPEDCVRFHLMWAQTASLGQAGWRRDHPLSRVLLIELRNPHPAGLSPVSQGRNDFEMLSTLLHDLSERVAEVDSDEQRALRFSAVGSPQDHGLTKVGCCYVDHHLLVKHAALGKIVIRNLP